jgi:predicted DNA-binding protein
MSRFVIERNIKVNKTDLVWFRISDKTNKKLDSISLKNGVKKSCLLRKMVEHCISDLKKEDK